MNCQNSLVSLAYIETSKNPLQVFCNFILYLLLKAPNQTLRADEIKEQLQSDFGISMPHQIISNCTRILERKQEVIRLPHAAGYKIGDTSFDIDSFENTRQRFAEHENKLLNSLVEFVSSQYKQKWSEEEAKKYLSNFLDTEGYGTQLFLKKKLELEQHYISPSFYIGRYVDSIQRQTDSVEKTYLEEIIYGMMVLQGIRQTGDYQQNRQQKFKGTVFYLDTKLVLRALGFSWKAQVDSVRETVRLLREKYDAEIGIFQETRTEVQNALSIAGRAFQKHRLIADGELKLYCELNPSEAKRLEDYADRRNGPEKTAKLSQTMVDHAAASGGHPADRNRTVEIQRPCSTSAGGQNNIAGYTACHLHAVRVHTDPDGAGVRQRCRLRQRDQCGNDTAVYRHDAADGGIVPDVSTCERSAILSPAQGCHQESPQVIA